MWDVRLIAETTWMDGKRKSINRLLKSSDVKAEALEYMKTRTEFLGCSVTITTPLHNTEYLFEYGGESYRLDCIS